MCLLFLSRFLQEFFLTNFNQIFSTKMAMQNSIARRVSSGFACTSYSSRGCNNNNDNNKCLLLARFTTTFFPSSSSSSSSSSFERRRLGRQQHQQMNQFVVAARRGFFDDEKTSSSSSSSSSVEEEEREARNGDENFKSVHFFENGVGAERSAGESGSGGEEGEKEGEGEGDEYSGVPLRSTISRIDLQKMERLIDEIVDNKDNRMSNRGKFRALPVTNKHRKQIEELEACVSLSEAGKRARILRNRASKAASEGGQAEAAAELNVNPTLRKYVLYGVVPEAHKDLLGRTKKRNTKFIAAASKRIEEMPSTEVKRKDENGMDVTVEVPEVAFCGRSNVGKSSLINAITLSAAARSSDTPGKTKSLNFYDIDSRLRMVDLPGYGFAFADESMVETWNRLMDEYLTTRPNLKCIFVVIDSRHGPKKSDREMLSYLSKYGKVPVHVVLNKTDMVRTEELCKRMFLLERELKFIKRSSNVLKLASASTGAGCTALFSEAFEYALPDADISRRNKREKAREVLEVEEGSEEDEGNTTTNKSGGGGGGKKFMKKGQQERREFVMGGEWIPGEGPAVVPTFTKDKKKKGGGKKGNGGPKGPKIRL